MLRRLLNTREHRYMKKRIIRCSVFAAFVAVMYFICYGGITVPKYALTSPKIQSDEIRIVLLTDLHSVIYGKNQQVLIEHVKKQEPDLIFLVGDIADDRLPIRGTRLLLEGIQDLAPIYYITGNHEYWSNDIQTIRDEIEAYGVRILADEYVHVTIRGTDLILAGVEDPSKQLHEVANYNQSMAMQNAFSDLESAEGYKILLAHRPEKIEEYLLYPFDLVVSGHTHGGQIRIPYLLNGLYAPHQGLFPQYGGGRYEHDEATHIISRGLAKDIKPRMFNPPEVVVITLVAENAQ